MDSFSQSYETIPDLLLLLLLLINQSTSFMVIKEMLLKEKSNRQSDLFNTHAIDIHKQSNYGPIKRLNTNNHIINPRSKK